jgi:hypothetical protein
MAGDRVDAPAAGFGRAGVAAPGVIARPGCGAGAVAGDDDVVGAGRIGMPCVGVDALDPAAPPGLGDVAADRCAGMLREGVTSKDCPVAWPPPESGPDIPEAFAAATPVPTPPATAPRDDADPAPPAADDVRLRDSASSGSPRSQPAGAVGSAGAHPAPECAPRAFTLPAALLPDKALLPRVAPAALTAAPAAAAALLPRVVAGGFQTVGRAYRPFERGVNGSTCGLIRGSTPGPTPTPEPIPK